MNACNFFGSGPLLWDSFDSGFDFESPARVPVSTPCPKCKEPVKIFDRSGTKVYSCPFCKNTWE